MRFRRSSWTMRVPRTHWPRSLSGVQMITRVDARSSAAATAAPAARASSASNSTIGQTTMPERRKRLLQQAETGSSAGSTPSPVL